MPHSKDYVVTFEENGIERRHLDGEYIQFTNIHSNDISFGLDQDNPNNLVLHVKSTGDQLVIKDYMKYEEAFVDGLHFADGVIWSPTDLSEKVEDMKLLGTEAADTMKGSASKTYSDFMDGQGGNDVIYAYDGADHLLGGAGNDTLYGGLGNDILEGGSGIDTYVLEKKFGQDTIINHKNEMNAQDIVQIEYSVNEFDFYMANNKSDLVLVHKQDSANATLVVDHYFDIEGARPITFKFNDFTSTTYQQIFDKVKNADLSEEKIKVYGSGKITGRNIYDFRESIYGRSGKDTIFGYAGEDRIYGGAGDDIIYGGAGDDDIDGQEGNDTLYGEGGDDYMEGNVGSDVLYGGEGSDILCANGRTQANNGNDVLHGGAGNDELRGSGDKDEHHGGEGNDTIRTDDGDDIVYGDEGNDRVYGGDGNNQMFGGTGNDTLYGKDGDDVLYGEEGDDRVYGYDDNDKLYGGSGDDRVKGGDGNDFLYGGIGDDELRGENGNDTYIFEANFGHDTIINRERENGHDTLRFDNNITDIRFARVGDNLLISDNAGNSVDVMQHFTSSYGKIDEVELESGASIQANQIELLIQAMSEYCSTNGVSWTSELAKNNEDVQEILSSYYSA